MIEGFDSNDFMARFFSIFFISFEWGFLLRARLFCGVHA